MSNARRAYVLLLLTVVYVFNLIDRQLITVLAPYVKIDLHLTDAQIALLYGTAFSLFYGLFGLPLARLADSWSRVRTLSLGLALWSFMTTASGFVQNVAQMGLVRAGVGVGETSSSPAAISLICECFSARRRGTAMAVYSTAVYVGGGISLMLGGAIVAWWTARYGSTGPLGLSGWRAAFILVGSPGLILAALIALTLREPPRGSATNSLRGAVAIVGREAAAIIPPWSYLRLRRRDKGAARTNLAILAVVAATAVALIVLTDHLLGEAHRSVVIVVGRHPITTNTVQWLAMAVAVYGTASWLQSLRLDEPSVFRSIGASNAYRSLVLGGSAVATGMHSLNAFTFLYAVRYLGAEPGSAVRLGVLAAATGLVGTLAGGAIGDRLRERHPAGRVHMLMACYLAFGAASAVEYSSGNSVVFEVAYGLATLTLSGWAPLINATAQDLLGEHERGRGYAALQLGTAVIGLGFGPYLIGLISDDTGSLRTGILVVILSTVPVALAAFAALAVRMGRRDAAPRDAAAAA